MSYILYTSKDTEGFSVTGTVVRLMCGSMTFGMMTSMSMGGLFVLPSKYGRWHHPPRVMC